MQDTPSTPVPPASPTSAPVYVRFHVVGLSVASALTVLILGLIAWPVHAMMWARAMKTYGVPGGPWSTMPGAPHAALAHYGMMHGPLHLVLAAIWIGIGAAIFAAVYNALAKR